MSEDRALGWVLLGASTIWFVVPPLFSEHWLMAMGAGGMFVAGICILNAIGDEIIAAHKQACIFKQNREQEEAEDYADRS